MMTYNNPEDHEIRLASLDIQRSILLQAPAGSGKTELLSQRILALLAVVQNPEEILAVTFTNKAANEMHTRVFERLQKAAHENIKNLKQHELLSFNLAKQALKNNNKQGWDLLNNPNRLQIKTIDSFNLSLVQRMPILSKIGALKNLELEPDKLYQEAVTKTLAHLEYNDEYAQSLITLLTHLENNFFSLQALLCKMLAKRDQWMRLKIDNNLSNNKQTLRQILSNVWSNLLNKIITDIENEAQAYRQLLDKYCRYSQDNLGITLPTTPYNTNNQSKIEWIKLWQNLILNKSGNPRKSVTKNNGFPVNNDTDRAIKNEFLDFINQIDSQSKLIFLLQQKLPNAEFSTQQWQVLEALFKVLQLLAANLQLVFTHTATVDFIEINIRAIEALGNLDSPTDLALYLDNKINHILVDEFQDTNHTQFILLKKLMEGWDATQTFFAVGDPMQSIYRFREADVGLFIKTKQQCRIGNIPLDFLQLTTNFRSTELIVDWVNHNFSAIFPKTSKVLQGAVSHNASKAYKNDSSSGVVNFSGFVSNDLSQETTKIVDTITHELNINPSQSIGILLRRKKDILPIATLLKQQNIPFRAIELDSLDTLPIVTDLRDLIVAFCYQKASGAWLSVLRAPWCGLSLIDLQYLVNIDPNTTIWQKLEQPNLWKQISPEGQIRLHYVSNIFKRAFDLRAQFPLENIIRKLAISLGLKEIIQYEYQKNASEMVFAILKNNTHNGVVQLDLLDESITKLYASPTNIDIKLECMTIYKAKGLEFDTVILPQLDYSVRKEDDVIMHWAETADGLLIAPMKATLEKSDTLYQYLSGLSKVKNLEEYKRLFYVACTRAIKNLYLFATLKPKNNECDIKPRKNCMLDFIWQIDPNLKTQLSKYDSDNKFINTKITHKIQRFTADFLKENYKHYPATTPIHSSWTGLIANNDSAQVVGIIFHLCCEHIAKIGVDNIDLSLVFDFMDKKLQQYHNIDTNIVSLKIKQLLNNMLGDETGRWLLDNKHKNTKQEWRISQKTNHKVSDFVIDRCFVDDNILWIVDYKTSSLNPDESIKNFSIRMVNCYAKQLLHYQDLLEPISNYPIKLMLYFPAISLRIDL